MVSRLATQLIRLPHPEGASSDMLWRYATLVDVPRSRSAISDPLTVELAQFLDGPAATSFARLLPDQNRIRTAYDTNPSTALCHGLVDNPLTGDDVLAAIAAGNGANAIKAAERLARRVLFTEAVQNGDDLDSPLGELQSHVDAAPLVALGSLNPIMLAGLLAGLTDGTFRETVIDALEPSTADAICHCLIGVLDPSCRTATVDDRLVEWLCASTSISAQASRDELTQSRDAAMDLLVRLDDDARRRLASHEELWVVVQRRTRLTGPSQNGPARSLDRGMLQSMRMAGMGVAEIAALVFNSRIDLTPEELAEELRGIDAIRLAGYFTAGNARHPRTGEIDALVATLDPFEQNRLAEAINGDIDQYPWVDELLVGVPRRYHGVTDVAQLEVLDRLLQAELGTDSKAWEVVLAMGEEWEGNLRSLVAAARQL
jgi:hypothetical protein